MRKIFLSFMLISAEACMAADSACIDQMCYEDAAVLEKACRLGPPGPPGSRGDKGRRGYRGRKGHKGGHGSNGPKGMRDRQAIKVSTDLRALGGIVEIGAYRAYWRHL